MNSISGLYYFDLKDVFFAENLVKVVRLNVSKKLRLAEGQIRKDSFQLILENLEKVVWFNTNKKLRLAKAQIRMDSFH